MNPRQMAIAMTEHLNKIKPFTGKVHMSYDPETIKDISYKPYPYSLHNPEEMIEAHNRITQWKRQDEATIWVPDSVKDQPAPQEGNVITEGHVSTEARFDSAFKMLAGGPLLFSQEGIDWGTEIYINVLRTQQKQDIVKQYRNVLKIHARRKAIISAYALRYTEFCRLNAESRRKQKRVSEQFKELVEWKKTK